MDSKITQQKKNFDERLADVQSSTSELLKAQEATLVSLKSRCNQLDDEMDKLLDE